MARLAATSALAVALASWIPVRAGQTGVKATPANSRPTAQAVEATLGRGRRVRVEFGLRGPLPVSRELAERCPRCGPDWVRVVVVRDAGNPSRVLARWEAPGDPTSIPWFDPEDGRVWHAGHPPQTLVTVVVPYGAKAMYLYALQWVGGELRQVGRVAADAGFSFSRRKSDGALVIIRRSGAQVDEPTEPTEYYVWDGLRFYDAGREFGSQ